MSKMRTLYALVRFVLRLSRPVPSGARPARKPRCGAACLTLTLCVAFSATNAQTTTAGTAPGGCDPACVHGVCSGGVCICDSGWAGMDCVTPVCFGDDTGAICGAFGTCVAPDTCACDAGWTGVICEILVSCDPPCVNGICVAPDTCACDAGWTGADCATPPCGDGLLDAGEFCDDGNTDDGDGCSSTCTVEPDSTCTGEPSVCITGIPVVSTWGLGVMVLLLLSAGTVVMMRRKPVVEA